MEVDSEIQSKHSATFNFPDADVVFQSSDGVLFHVHTANLEFGSDGFPPTAIKPEQHEIIELPEDSKILELLFRFVYPRLLPDLEELEFSTLEQLAEAVEKYQVHMGRKQCNVFMAQEVEKHPLLVLNYAIKHNYPVLANSAAPNVTLSQLGTKDITSWVSRELLDLWLPYYYQRTEAIRTTTEQYSLLRKIHRTHSGLNRDGCPYPQCTQWQPHQKNILAALASAPGPDWTIWRKITIPTESSQCCLTETEKWRNELEKKLKGLEPFIKI